MSKPAVSQDVSGGGNQSAGEAGSLHQINSSQSINLELHLSLPHSPKLFALHVMHININLEGGAGGDDAA